MSVSVIKCNNYAEVEDAVKKSIKLIGGIEKFLNENERVVVKPNLLRDSRPEQHIVTHPSVVRAVVKLVQSAGCEVIIADSPGWIFTKGYLEKVYKKSGLLEVAEETGAKLNYDTTFSLISNPGGKLLKAIHVMNVVKDADAVISLPKFKTHNLTQFTGAIKNLFGVVPGLNKTGYHAKLKDVKNFSEMLIDVLQLINPRLSIMDAVVGMEGNGPSAGNPREVGAILASSDPVALDIVAATIANMDPLRIPPIRVAFNRGLTTGKVKDINLLGDDLQGLIIEDFKQPSTGAGILARFMSVFQPWASYFLVPYPVSTEKCIGCGICRDSCPVKAITITKGKAYMGLNKCIRCYCCHELCPHDAIDLKKSWIGNLVNR